MLHSGVNPVLAGVAARPNDGHEPCVAIGLPSYLRRNIARKGEREEMTWRSSHHGPPRRSRTTWLALAVPYRYTPSGMNIFWHGHSCVRIETETRIGPVSLVTDPFDGDSGVRFPKNLTPDIVVLSHQDKKRFSMAFENKPFIVSDPGEYEAKGVFVVGVPVANADGSHPHAVMYRFTIEGMKIGFLGGMDRVPTDHEIALLEDIDILLLPVGGGGFLDAKQAMETITRIEPRMVIPLGHAIDGTKGDVAHVDAFCQAMGACKRNDVAKLKIQKKDLPADETIITVIEKS